MFLFNLTANEISKIKEEILLISPNFNHHSTNPVYMNYGGLREGKSVWLNKENKGKHLGSCPTIKNIITRAGELLNSRNIGRAYVHKLDAHQVIHRHADSDDVDPYFGKIIRCHIYLDIPKNIEIIHSGDKIEENTVIVFNHQSLHEYKNNSKDTLTFIVFDLLK